VSEGGKDVHRETAMIALKAVIAQLPAGGPAASVAVGTAVPQLLAAVTQARSTEIVNSSLECLSEVNRLL
jgi:hypothetical protein